MAGVRPCKARCGDGAAGREGDGLTLLLGLARAFINFFGITKPSVEHERRTAWFICVLLLLIVVGMLAALAAFLRVRG